MNEDYSADEIGRLLRFAGEREGVAPERLENARARVGEHWQGVVRAQRRKRFRLHAGRLAMAASLVVATGVALLLWQSPDQPPATRVAVVERVSGDVLVDGRALRSGETIAIGNTVETRPFGRAAMLLADGQSVRLDSASRLVISARNRFELLSGGIYVDSGPTPGDSQVFIETVFGIASDVGTQFQVRIDDGLLQIGVREGRVELARPAVPAVTVDSGNLLELSAGSRPSTLPLAVNDPIWQWVAAISPVFEIEGATLEEYLSWYARESGLSLEWASPESRASAARTQLSGSIRNLSLEEGLALVRRIAPFDFRVSGTILHVSVE